MNIWPAVWESWVGEWNPSDVPKHSYYDYVKCYSYNPGEGNYGTDNNFTFLWEDNFNIFNTEIWADDSEGTFSSNYCSFTPINTNLYNGHMILSLTDINDVLNCNEISGDINEDNSLDILDIVLIVNIILDENSSSLSTCQILASDSDFNQLLNIFDIVMIVNRILEN